MVSQRVHRHGMAILEGDFVVDHAAMAERTARELEAEAEAEDAEATKGGGNKGKYTTKQHSKKGKDRSRRVIIRALSVEELDATPPQDVLLPLPGFDVKYPSTLGDLYEARLAADGLTVANLKSHDAAFSLAGDYRAIFVKPKDIEWHYVKSALPHQQLVPTDLDHAAAFSKEKNTLIAPAKTAATVAATVAAAAAAEEEEEGCTSEDKDNTSSSAAAAADAAASAPALVLEFTLPTSCYATMALREVLKSRTDSAYQGTL